MIVKEARENIILINRILPKTTILFIHSLSNYYYYYNFSSVYLVIYLFFNNIIATKHIFNENKIALAILLLL